MSRRFLIVYCGLLMTVSAFSTDVVLPVIGLASEALGSPIELAQMTVPIYMVGLGLSQLLFGPASDKYGRRPVVMAGLAVFTLGSVICLVAPNIEVLLFGRLVQGLGGGACQVISRAIVRDRFSGRELASNMALVTAIFAFGPIVAPLMGYVFALVGSWRAVFVATLLFDFMLLVMALRSRETIARRQMDALQPRALLARARRVLAHPQSRFFLLTSGVVMTTIISYLTNAPRLFVEALGTSELAFVLWFAFSAIGIIIGQMVNRRLIERLDTVRASIIGASVLVASMFSVMLLDLLGLSSALGLGLAMLTFNTSYLVVFANSVSMVLDPHGDIAGFTASFVGFASPLIASTGGALVTFLADGAILPWSIAMISVALTCLAMLVWWHRRQPT